MTDGGGVRGYSTLLILRELMSKIKALETQPAWMREYDFIEDSVRSSADYPWQEDTYDHDSQFYPCHYFDYIAGTSTGGLIAIMLGRLRMSVEEAIEKFRYFGDSVFAKERLFHERRILYFPRAKYSTRRTRKAFLEIIRESMKKHGGGEVENYEVETEPFAMHKNCDQFCHTLVISRKKSGRGVEKTYVHRTYDHHESHEGSYVVPNSGMACRSHIWQVARATSAAPRYFEAHEEGDDTYLDGGMGHNNPSDIVFHEVINLHKHYPSIHISIGTGQPAETIVVRKKDQLGEIRKQSRKQFIKKYLEIGNAAKKILTDTEMVAANVKLITDRFNTEHVRFNVPNDIRRGTGDTCLGQIPLDEWLPTKQKKQKGGEAVAVGAITTGKIETMTREYLDYPKVQEQLEDYARKLVLIRRRRARTDRWEKYATNICYDCGESVQGCAGDLRGPTHRRTFRTHIMDHHSELVQGKSRKEVEQVISQYRMFDRQHFKRGTTRTRTRTGTNTWREEDRRNWTTSLGGGSTSGWEIQHAQ
ncbi:uncharacterized protein Z518_03724 [Rhinocladiella mackenziei CBS 650.93]|uniref:PNPLA domain-containing protein n=1 Tax=Rhinocladiella mackenziei CBS 650.93 TaxID=1442369 RepID=A0A0D2FUH0_9EURO|nr:uncharacterized protein Z518_03724 [Rhinocladiella mackenziei CBS 650.93]KIX05752.1 hypothetical protein Z518_03724 [Rhinocladiella mackenziei CBS 650.93]